ncbi:MAG: Tim44/TimA family putative adaptor protein [Devosiaceae bacterium]|nr:Tim44/TimA family putative adaptor protein [Devosiaceae bacterium]
MNEFMDIPTLIFIGVAILVLLRLRSVLGTRTGTERPPSTRISEQEQENQENSNDENSNDENVVALHPSKSGKSKPQQQDEIAQDEKAQKQLLSEIKKFAKNDEDLALGLTDINKVDASFTPASFIGGAKSAYEMIVTAFAQGDKKTLKALLEKDVYEGFQAAIKQREQSGYKVDFTFIGLPKVEFANAKLEDNIANVTIRFFAEVVSATRDGDGNLIEGNGDQVANIADIWTFARNTKANDPNWKLVATDQLD